MRTATYKEAALGYALVGLVNLAGLLLPASPNVSHRLVFWADAALALVVGFSAIAAWSCWRNRAKG